MCCSTNRSQIYSDESRISGKNNGKSNFKRKYNFLAFDINRNQPHYDSYIMLDSRFELCTLLLYAHFIVKIEILNYFNGFAESSNILILLSEGQLNNYLNFSSTFTKTSH